MARGHDERQFRLLRGADQHIPAVGLPISHQHHLVPKSAATQPAASADVGTDGPTYQAVPTVTARAAPVAKPSVPRQTLEVGAECVSSARSDLCGGWSAMAISTAKDLSSRVPTQFRMWKAIRTGAPFASARYDPAWSQTLACADASCTGTGRSHGRPAALITCAALVRIGKARSRSR